MHAWSKQMEMKELLRAGLDEIGGGEAVWEWDRRTVSRWQTESEPTGRNRRTHKLDPYKALIRRRFGELSGVDGPTVVRGGSRGGLRREIQSGSGLPSGVAAGGSSSPPPPRSVSQRHRGIKFR